MKTRLFIIGLFAFFSISLNAQVTTLLSEDFNNSALPGGWLNIDEDGLPQDSLSVVSAKEWFFANFLSSSSDSNELVAQSSSWLQDFLPGNRDWLITKAVAVSGSNLKLKWRSAPAQVGLYQDGYTVLVSTTDASLSSFTDTIATYAQNINDDATQFSSGTQHTASEANPDGTAGFNFGLLESWEASLDAYNGKTIYVAFLHDSDDDWLLAVDDVMITEGTASASIGENSLDYSVEVYPNPAAESLNINYDISGSEQLQISILSIDGKMVYNEYFAGKGNSIKTIDISEFNNGSYLLYFRNNDNIKIRKFSKLK